jgi:putative ABC transport system permease protein
VVLAAGGALMVRGFGRLMDVYRGLDPGGVLTLGMVLPDWRYREPQAIASFYERILAELGTIPGVESAALVSHLPADPGPMPSSVFAIEGRAVVEVAEQPAADLQAASPAYFSTLRIPLRAGRLLGEADRAGAPAVVVVSESLARRFWPGEEPLGRRLRLGRSEAANANPWLTVVGVVGDVRQYWFDRQPRPTLYVPYLQAPRRGMSAVLRAVGDPESLMAAVRGRVAAVDPTQPIEEMKSLARLVGEQMAFLRTAASLVSGLALLSCLLAAVGVYGLLGHHVAQSVPELGVRVALGAGRRDILRLVLGRAAKLAAIGAALGLPGAFAVGKLLAGSLYGVVGADPALLAVIAALLAAVALLAGWVPARRAARVDPAATLRGG